MSQVVLNIPNESLKEKIMWFLERFKNDGLEIKETQKEKPKYSEEYIKKNWKKLAMGTKSDDGYYKSEQYYEDRFEDYKQRGKI